MKPKHFIVQFAIIAALLILPVALLSWLTRSFLFGNSTLDINLHDTYFVIHLSRPLLIMPGLILVIIVYLFKATYNHFKSRFQNIVLLAALLALNALTLSAMQTTGKVTPPNAAGWTVYPPLSALPAQQDPLTLFGSMVHSVLFYIQLLLLALLAFIAILTWRNWKVEKK